MCVRVFVCVLLQNVFLITEIDCMHCQSQSLKIPTLFILYRYITPLHHTMRIFYVSCVLFFASSLLYFLILPINSTHTITHDELDNQLFSFIQFFPSVCRFFFNFCLFASSSLPAEHTRTQFFIFVFCRCFDVLRLSSANQLHIIEFELRR